jgi:hypothetical protein
VRLWSDERETEADAAPLGEAATVLDASAVGAPEPLPRGEKLTEGHADPVGEGAKNDSVGDAVAGRGVGEPPPGDVEGAMDGLALALPPSPVAVAPPVESGLAEV